MTFLGLSKNSLEAAVIFCFIRSLVYFIGFWGPLDTLIQVDTDELYPRIQNYYGNASKITTTSFWNVLIQEEKIELILFVSFQLKKKNPEVKRAGCQSVLHFMGRKMKNNPRNSHCIVRNVGDLKQKGCHFYLNSWSLKYMCSQFH